MYSLPFASLPSMFHISVSCDTVLLVNKEEICFSLITLLVNSGCCNKVPLIEWLINNISQFLWSSGGWKYEIWWEPTFQLADGCLLTVTSHNRENSMGGLFDKGTNPILGGSSSQHNHITKASPFNTIILGIRASTAEFWGRQNPSADKLLSDNYQYIWQFSSSTTFMSTYFFSLILLIITLSGLSFLSCHYLGASYLIAPCLDGESNFLKHNGISHPCPLKVISSLPSIWVLNAHVTSKVYSRVNFNSNLQSPSQSIYHFVSLSSRHFHHAWASSLGA